MTQKPPTTAVIPKISSARGFEPETTFSSHQLKTVLDALPTHVALLDSNGEILLVNEAWQNFAEENGMTRADSETGNYLEVCEKAAASGDTIARKTLEGLRKVLTGKAPRFELDYPCDAPDQPRWFRLSVAPVALWGDRCAVLTHSDLTRKNDSKDATSPA